MAGNKPPHKKKEPTRVKKNPANILNRLTVPDDRIARLKRRADQELLRLYMRTGVYQDVVSLYTTLMLGKQMLRYIDDPAEPLAMIERAESALADYDKDKEVIDLDAVRDALDVCYSIWRLVSVNEFVAAAKEIKVKENQEASSR